MKLDAKDRIIITMYAEDPDVSQEKIAQRIRLSQPSVAARVSRLKKNGALDRQVGISPLRMGPISPRWTCPPRTPRHTGHVRNCPYFANGFSVSGRHNLCLFFFSESVATLESIVNGHIRSDPTVKEVDFNIVVASVKDFCARPIEGGEDKGAALRNGRRMPQVSFVHGEEMHGLPGYRTISRFVLLNGWQGGAP